MPTKTAHMQAKLRKSLNGARRSRWQEQGDDDDDEDPPDEDEEEEAAEGGEIFADYRPSKLSIGKPHPDPVVETASLAAVEPPDITYKLHIQVENKHTI